MGIAQIFDRNKLATIADYLMVAVAVSVPWSTSATGILLALWLIALLPTLSWSDLHRELLSAAGGLPVALFLLGAVGMAWADVTWHERFGGLSGFVRLLAIPLLMVQFRRSDGGMRVLIGFLTACVALLIASCIIKLWPALHPTLAINEGVPVKTYIVQSLEFMMCAAVLLDLAVARAGLRQWKIAASFFGLALAFLCDIFFVTTGRTALVVMPVLVLLYGFRHSGWKGIFAAGLAGCILAAVVWTASPYVRERVTGIYSETVLYETKTEATSSGIRINFWKRSLGFIESAPLLGHGTGSIRELFQNAMSGGAYASNNPHNQTFAVGIQLGLLGMTVLWAMWIFQLLLFRVPGLLAWIGLVVVTSNIVGSLFNSFIFDFTEGWLYVIGVGVMAGMVQRTARES